MLCLDEILSFFCIVFVNHSLNYNEIIWCSGSEFCRDYHKMYPLSISQEHELGEWWKKEK